MKEPTEQDWDAADKLTLRRASKSAAAEAIAKARAEGAAAALTDPEMVLEAAEKLLRERSIVDARFGGGCTLRAAKKMRRLDVSELSNELITAAEKLLRKLNDGREPYAASVLPMARALAELAEDASFVLPAAEKLLRARGWNYAAGICGEGDI